jgi:hypothetical protein
MYKQEQHLITSQRDRNLHFKTLHVRHFCGVTENKEVKNLDKS